MRAIWRHLAEERQYALLRFRGCLFFLFRGI